MKVEFCITPPSKYPTCHASSICELADGDLLACCYAGKQEGSPDSVVLGARYDRGSGRWQDPEIWVDVAHHAAGNPRVFVGPERGEVWLVAPIDYPSPGIGWCHGATRLFFKRSYDSGRTWTDLEILYEGKGILGKNKPLICGSYCLLPVEQEEKDIAKFLLSEDGGKTWSLHGDLGVEAGARLEQPTVVELADGTLLAYMRSQEDRIFKSTSRDRGKSWSRAEATPLPNNNSGIDMVRLRSGNLALVYNPTSKDNPTAWGGPRTPLEIALSTDEGKNWPHRVTLEEGPGEFSYPAIIQGTDGMIHITYTHLRKAIRHVRMTEEDILRE